MQGSWTPGDLKTKEAGPLGVVHDNGASVIGDEGGFSGIKKKEGGYATDVEGLAELCLP